MPKNFLYSGMDPDLTYYPNSLKIETLRALWKVSYTPKKSLPASMKKEFTIQDECSASHKIKNFLYSLILLDEFWFSVPNELSKQIFTQKNNPFCSLLKELIFYQKTYFLRFQKKNFLSLPEKNQVFQTKRAFNNY